MRALIDSKVTLLLRQFAVFTFWGATLSDSSITTNNLKKGNVKILIFYPSNVAVPVPVLAPIFDYNFLLSQKHDEVYFLLNHVPLYWTLHNYFMTSHVIDLLGRITDTHCTR